jgi:branched-chain amino acid transport system substrate-binding protein
MQWTFVTSLSAGLVLVSGVAFAGGQNAPGITDTEIKIGQTMPYSGPASAWGAIGRAELAYVKMINDQRRNQRSEDHPDKPGRRLQSS